MSRSSIKKLNNIDINFEVIKLYINYYLKKVFGQY